MVEGSKKQPRIPQGESFAGVKLEGDNLSFFNGFQEALRKANLAQKTETSLPEALRKRSPHFYGTRR